MAISKHRKKLSRATKNMLKGGENDTVDFKAKPEGLSSDDLVAFANSGGGGTILLGVKEHRLDDGSQVGCATGCNVDDATLLGIMNKAVDCIPPVSITVEREDFEQGAILVVRVLESETKPHATRKGIYCVRDGNRNRPLHPNELLEIFVEREAETFSRRFEETTNRIETAVSELEIGLSTTIDNMASQLGWTDYKLGNTEGLLDSVNSQVSGLSKSVDDVHKRLRTLFRQDDRDDEVFDQQFEEFKDSLNEQLIDDPELKRAAMEGRSIQISTHGRRSAELTEPDVRAAFQAVLQGLRVDEQVDDDDETKA